MSTCFGVRAKIGRDYISEASYSNVRNKNMEHMLSLFMHVKSFSNDKNPRLK